MIGGILMGMDKEPKRMFFSSTGFGLTEYGLKKNIEENLDTLKQMTVGGNKMERVLKHKEGKKERELRELRKIGANRIRHLIEGGLAIWDPKNPEARIRFFTSWVPVCLTVKTPELLIELYHGTINVSKHDGTHVDRYRLNLGEKLLDCETSGPVWLSFQRNEIIY